MSDYSKGKIYKIISSECDDVYYGSTVKSLNQRLNLHLQNYKTYLKGERRYMTSFEIIDKSNYEIVLVENYPCNSKEELELREAEYIKNNQCVNKYIPCRTQNEWRKDNHQKTLGYKKKWRETNREKINEKISCEICGYEISKSNIRRHQRSEKCLS
jgi:hypothetical protein